MKNLGAGLAVGITAICSSIVSSIGLIYGKETEICSSIMLVPVFVAVVIFFGDGWE